MLYYMSLGFNSYSSSVLKKSVSLYIYILLRIPGIYQFGVSSYGVYMIVDGNGKLHKLSLMI